MLILCVGLDAAAALAAQVAPQGLGGVFGCGVSQMLLLLLLLLLPARLSMTCLSRVHEQQESEGAPDCGMCSHQHGTGKVASGRRILLSVTRGAAS